MKSLSESAHENTKSGMPPWNQADAVIKAEKHETVDESPFA